MSPPLRNPEEYCPVCQSRFGFADEVCENCGFDPVHNDLDAAAYEKYLEEWKESQK